MGAVIRSIADYQAHAAHRTEVIDRHVRLSLEFSATQIITFWRGIEGFPIQTGNLQHSVGVNRLIAASRQRIGSLPSSGEAVNVRALVKKRAQGYSVFLPVGMEYARHLEPRLQVPAVIAYARTRIEENHQKSMRNAIAELEAA